MGFDEAISLDELNKAAISCAKRVGKKESVQNYLIHKAQRNERLREDILNGTYHLSPYHRFVITEPKTRVIHATAYRDRVWQRSMCVNGVGDDLTKSFIYDNGACQAGKGTEFAIERIIRFLQYTYRVSGGNKFYYVHLDIKGFFPSTPHKVLKQIVRERITDKRFIPYLDEIIDGCKDTRPAEVVEKDPFGERGTILGSEIGQRLQLAVHDKMDHYIKEVIKVKCYIRYNDDILIIGEKEQINRTVEYITSYMSKIGLTVKNKSGIQKAKHGIRFMKKTFIIKSSGKVIVRPLKEKIAKERKTLKKLKKKVDDGKIEYSAVQMYYQSKVGSISKCNANRTMEHLDKYYENTFGTKPNYVRRKKNAYSRRKRKVKRT